MPAYTPETSALLGGFFHVLGHDLMIAKPVMVAITGGTARHCLVADLQVRALFASLRAMVLPTSLLAPSQDWRDPVLGLDLDLDLDQRIERTVRELIALITTGFEQSVRSAGQRAHQSGSVSKLRATSDMDYDTELIQFAAA
jgi:FMN reductase